jgi:hypothetical protein
MSSTNPNLDALIGSPAYFPLLSGSPAINAGNDAICAAAPVSNTSQNGVTRPQGTHCDIGSYELPITTLTLRSIGANDGWILESSETSGKGGTKSSTATLLYIGDNAQKKQYRTILSFNTAGLLDTAVIIKVTLKLKLQGTIGANPFNTHGNLLVDIRKGPFGGIAALQVGDFQATSSKDSAGTIPKTPVSGWYTKSFSSTVFTYINKAGVTQFRLRFAKDDDNDAIADYLKFYSGNASPVSYRPKLIIDYHVP